MLPTYVQELELGDVVCYWSGSSYPFCDMQVVRFADDGVYLRRPYLNDEGEAAYEELYWHKDSKFLFKLIDKKGKKG